MSASGSEPNQLPPQDRTWDGDVVWSTSGSLKRRGVVLAVSFWGIIAALLCARVALFDEISAAQIASLLSAKVAALSSALVQ